MREVLSVVTTAALLMLALLPGVAAVSPEPMVPPAGVPMAIAQPIATIDTSLSTAATPSVRLPESGLLLVVGTALLGLGALVRRTTT